VAPGAWGLRHSGWADTRQRLSSDDYDEFMEILRNLDSSREKIKEAMGFALDNAECSEEVVQLLKESLTLAETALPIKIARLYLCSDILHNR
jgi:U2-associated protein SR140